MPPPFLNAGNAGPFTLDGTRTYRVGRGNAVLVDPGPDVERHVRALVGWVADAEQVRILLTHGHGDHAGSAGRLAGELGCPVLGPRGVSGVDLDLEDGATVETDEGVLVAVSTPGHAAQHLCYHWPESRALFAGDLLLGKGDTTWVGEYPGCVADYLASLERVRALDPSVIYPAHGPALEDVSGTLRRYEAHRRARIRQVETALAGRPDADVEELLEVVYGRVLPPGTGQAARMSLQALMDHVRA
ncbi:MAG TPA: MBL fold metallo-hydrolase [Longimicrobiales bacterium]|nr:MBL fold metallo-hydrolase [Longimicrobiales bacterium]